jgi:hypothetical protein
MNISLTVSWSAWRLVVLAFVASLPLCARADDFAAIASPPRFELAGKAGTPIREVVEITNASAGNAKYAVRTADWSMDANAGVQFTDALQAGSCRPWVSIERHEINVPSRGKYRFRFQIDPPADAPRQECRFALMIEGDEQIAKTPAGVAFPISGRLGVIVYVRIGDAQPKIEIVGSATADVNGARTPVLQVRNNGDAHARLSGFLSGTDAKGAKLEFAPTMLPILPGETRTISLVVDHESDTPAPVVALPITISGKLEWADQSIPYEHRFEP